MSEQISVQLELDDERLLLESLEKMGYKPKLYEDGTELQTYYNNKTKPKAHIVIDKSQFGGYSAVGFERVKGKFNMHLDNMDQKKFKVNKLKQTYSEVKLMKVIKNKARYSVKNRTEEEGKVRIRLRCNF